MKHFFFVCIAGMALLLSCNESKNTKDQPVKRTSPDSVNPVKPNLPSVNPYAVVDVSPMDMSYYPTDYPKLKMDKKVSAPPMARVIYSRPHLQGRHIFHEVLKYDEPWRLGANEATELDLYNDVTIMDKKIKAGRYILYCIPHANNWTVILNSNIDNWGLEQDPNLDIARFTVPVIQTKNNLEFFTMVFEKKDKGAELLMAWDNVEVRLPIQF
ncbi:MAG: DUF2911 domain-containing protein [Bacteroidetes bacterium]|nr:DUF2911 domain-containing protein [Bacteroidota bacterium]